MLVNHIRYTRATTIYGMGEDKSIKKVLWRNVQALMVQKYGRENINRLAADAKIGIGSVQRIKAAETSVGVDLVEAVAEAFQVYPWQLLCALTPKMNSIGDDKLLVVLRAWQDTDGRGRRMLLLAAEGAAEDEPTRDRPTGRAARP